MHCYLLLADSAGDPIPEHVRRRYERARCCTGLAVTWRTTTSAVAMLARDPDTPATIGAATVQWNEYLAVGDVRLDNRPDIVRWAGVPRTTAAGMSDLELVVRVIAMQGDGIIARILGDFAFAIWDTTTRRLIAARDAFGVRRLCYREGSHRLAFASRAELLAEGDAYDVQPLVEMIAMCDPSPDRTVYAGVRAVPPATWMRGQGGRLSSHEYWAPENFEPAPVAAGKEQECYDTFRALFADAVRQRLTGAPDVWSQLSGGLDSSSVVSMAGWLAQRGEVPHGVAGTISWVYRWATDGDERRYSDEVVKRWDVRNEVMLNDWFWEDDGEEPPLTDEPDSEYTTWARERRSIRLIRSTGGYVLLTGLGSDQYLLGNMLFFADWIAQGRTWKAVREMLDRAALGRVSFWRLAYTNAVLPFLPRLLRARMMRGATTASWIAPHLVQQYNVGHTIESQSYEGPLGQKYTHAVRRDVRSLHRYLRRNFFLGESLDVRHPFLSRPLVEFCLRLPPGMCVRPYARKWILRQAMREILPERVRVRIGKGSNFGTVHQSLLNATDHFPNLLADPILAQLGCIDPVGLRVAYASACKSGALNEVGPVVYVLAIETWLQVRSGRRIVKGNVSAIRRAQCRSLAGSLVAAHS